MKAVDTVIVTAKSDSIDRLFTRNVMFLLQVEQAEVILANTATRAAKIGKCLVYFSIVNHWHVLRVETLR